jgi:hypothetical protein
MVENLSERMHDNHNDARAVVNIVVILLDGARVCLDLAPAPRTAGTSPASDFG